MNVTRTWALAALLAAACGAHASTVTVASDGLNNASTGSLNGQAGGTGWGGAWTGSNSVSVITVGDTDNAISGQALRFAGANNTSAATRELDAAIGGTQVMVQFDLQFQAGEIGRNDFLSLWLGSSTGPSMGLKGDCDKATGCDADLFVRANGSGGAFTTPVTVGQTYHLFALLEKINGASIYNRYSLWVDPTAEEMFNLSGADAVSNGSSGLSSFDTIGFRTANLGAGDVVLVDNVNISVVPEPGTLALASLALLGLAATARRRNKA